MNWMKALAGRRRAPSLSSGTALQHLPTAEESPLASVDTGPFLSSFLSSGRTLLLDGHVQLKRGLQRQERHLFLFNDLLVVAKIKRHNQLKMKTSIKLSDMWTASCVDEVEEGNSNAMRSFVLGWPTVNFEATFSSPQKRDEWLSTLQRHIRLEKEKDYPKSIPLRIFTKDVGNCAYYTTIKVSNSDTANQVIHTALARLRVTDPDRAYQLWVSSGPEASPYPLAGHEIPYKIQMSHLQDTALLTRGSEDSACTSSLPEPFLTEQLPGRTQCRFTLQPHHPAAAQQTSVSGRKPWMRNGLSPFRTWSLRNKSRASRPVGRKTESLTETPEPPHQASGVPESNSLQDSQKDLPTESTQGHPTIRMSRLQVAEQLRDMLTTQLQATKQVGAVQAALGMATETLNAVQTAQEQAADELGPVRVALTAAQEGLGDVHRALSEATKGLQVLQTAMFTARKELRAVNTAQDGVKEALGALKEVHLQSQKELESLHRAHMTTRKGLRAVITAQSVAKSKLGHAQASQLKTTEGLFAIDTALAAAKEHLDAVQTARLGPQEDLEALHTALFAAAEALDDVQTSQFQSTEELLVAEAAQDEMSEGLGALHTALFATEDGLSAAETAQATAREELLAMNTAQLAAMEGLGAMQGSHLEGTEAVVCLQTALFAILDTLGPVHTAQFAATKGLGAVCTAQSKARKELTALHTVHHHLQPNEWPVVGKIAQQHRSNLRQETEKHASSTLGFVEDTPDLPSTSHRDGRGKEQCPPSPLPCA
ncbi:centrosome-associated protein CEP250-like [Saccopteryx leptura]|uniref:centrosome-associated protein CEP250-like n=1 Tax=Saccopteryx leptura TaxID=249018 RepID=UPI00339BA999